MSRGVYYLDQFETIRLLVKLRLTQNCFEVYMETGKYCTSFTFTRGDTFALGPFLHERIIFAQRVTFAREQFLTRVLLHERTLLHSDAKKPSNRFIFKSVFIFNIANRYCYSFYRILEKKSENNKVASFKNTHQLSNICNDFPVR